MKIRDEKCAGKAAELARRIGKDPTYVTRMLYPEGKDGKKRIADEMIEAIESAFPGWLQDAEHANVKRSAIGGRAIPVINSVQAGNPKEVADSFMAGAGFDEISTDLDLSDCAFALVIDGPSMEPEFKTGDKVIIDPRVAPRPGDFVVAKCNGDEATFKKYRPRGVDEDGNEVFDLVPLNEDYAPLHSGKNHCRIIGTMMEHRKYRRG